MDDLKFFFSLNKIFIYNNVFENFINTRKEYHFGNNECNAIIIVTVIKEIFKDKLNPILIENLILEFKQYVIGTLKDIKTNERLNKDQKDLFIMDKSSNSSEIDTPAFDLDNF